jgi:hypothetical protein
MQLLTSFGDTRRSRRRQAVLSGTRLAVIALLALVGAGASYQIGRSQGRIELARLQADIAAQQELNRLLSARAAAAEQGAEAAVTKAARLQQAYNSEVPRGEMRTLIGILERRLKEGVPADRLAFLLREAEVARQCDPQTESKHLAVHTSAAIIPPANVTFAKDKIIITSEGAPTRRPDGTADPAFDPAKTVTLRFLRIGRDVAKVEGQLPLSHALVLGDKEYLFAAKATERTGLLEITAQTCNYP